MRAIINIKSLLEKHVIESNRLEYKESWNPRAIYRSVVAFANDFDNAGGGYIIVGVTEKDGVIQRPVKGVPLSKIDRIQKEILQFNNKIEPPYFPRVSVEDIDGKKVLLIWVPGGPSRPYTGPCDVTVPKSEKKCYIRYNASSIIANGEQFHELHELCNQVPFDDRANTQAIMHDISFVLLRDYLVRVKSQVDDLEKTSIEDLLLRMDLLVGPKEHQYLKNVALMMFSPHPEKFFPYTQVEIVIFPRGRREEPNHFEEVPPIMGPIPRIIESVMSYLRTNIIREKIVKIPSQLEAVKCFNYPYQALEEAVVNAMYHRNYQLREPVEIVVEPDKITITSYNGPDVSVTMDDLKQNKVRARRYRNRKIGDYLKELQLTEGRGTGIPTIYKELQANGSAAPFFEIDEHRRYFLVEIPCHPSFIGELPVLVKSNERINELNERINGSNERINDGNERINDENERINGSNERINDGNERINPDDGDLSAQILTLLAQEGGMNAKTLAQRLSKGRSTIYTCLARLRQQQRVEFRGARKNGAYYLCR